MTTTNHETTAARDLDTPTVLRPEFEDMMREQIAAIRDPWWRRMLARELETALTCHEDKEVTPERVREWRESCWETIDTATYVQRAQDDYAWASENLTTPECITWDEHIRVMYMDERLFPEGDVKDRVLVAKAVETDPSGMPWATVARVRAAAEAGHVWVMHSHPDHDQKVEPCLAYLPTEPPRVLVIVPRLATDDEWADIRQQFGLDLDKIHRQHAVTGPDGEHVAMEGAPPLAGAA